MFNRTGGLEAFKEMARTGGPVELSYVKGSIQETALELDIDPGRISKWRRSAAAATAQKNDQTLPANTTLTDEQQQIRRLQRELREAQMDRTAKAARYTKNRCAGPRQISIFSRGDRVADRGKYSDL